MKLKGVLTVGLMSAAALMSGSAIAQEDYPNRPITVIVPYGAGGGVSINARALAPHLSEALGQEVVVENRTGAGGVTGHTIGATADPDGYTLTMVSPGIAAAPLLIEGVQFTPEDFAYIGQVTFVPNFLAVNADSPYQTLEELVQAMKENPGEFSVGRTQGWPSSDIAMAKFLSEADVEANVITGQSGGADKLAGVLGGHLDIVMGNINEVLPQHEAGELRILAAAAPERAPELPDVPTFNELGYDVETGVWRTLAAPAETPQEVIDTLNAALQEALAMPELEEDFEQANLTIDYLGPEETRDRVMQQYEDLGQMFSELGMNVQDQ